MPRIVRLHAFTGPEGLHIDELPSREPGKGEARLRVEAIGLGRDQFVYLEGRRYSGQDLDATDLPLRLGYEVAGVVDAVGAGVDESWVGRRVAPASPFDESRYGCYGEEGIVPADLLWEYPDRLTPAQAAAFWVPYGTAYGLVGTVDEGDVVALPAASSAVGAAALQIVGDAGAVSIATTRSTDKVEELRRRGADHVIVTGHEDYVTQVMEITEGHGANVTFDPIGGDFLTQAAAASAFGGTIIAYGVLAGTGQFPQGPVIGKALTVRGYTVGQVVTHPAKRAEAIAYFEPRLADGRFTPTVAATFGLDDFVAGYAEVEANTSMGRVIVQP